MRVYLPSTLPLLERWLDAGQVDGPRTVYAVTPALREWYREADLDELEHAAQIAASVGSLELLTADGDAPRRRVVVAADVDDAALASDEHHGRAAMRLSGTVAVARWSSALIDDAAARLAVTAACDVVGRLDADDGEAQFAGGGAEAHELGWYAVQELRHLFV